MNHIAHPNRKRLYIYIRTNTLPHCPLALASYIYRLLTFSPGDTQMRGLNAHIADRWIPRFIAGNNGDDTRRGLVNSLPLDRHPRLLCAPPGGVNFNFFTPSLSLVEE